MSAKRPDLIDYAIFSQLKQLDDDDLDYPLTKSMIEQLFQQIEEALENWSILVQNNNIEEVERQAHGLKGSSSQCGAMKLAEYFGTLAHLKNDNVDVEESKTIITSVINTIKENDLVSKTKQYMYMDL